MFLPRLAPRFDVALRDVGSARAEFRLEAAQALANATDEAQRQAARTALRAMLDDPLARIRAAALTSLGRVGDDEDVPALLRATRDERPAIREAATIALGNIATESARQGLRGLLDSVAAEVRYQAIEALAAQLDSPAHAAVAERLGDSDDFVREAAASALGVLGAEEHRDALAARLSDTPAVRLAAALSLASVGDRRAVPALRAAVRAGRPDTETLLALVRLSAQDACEDLAAIVRRPIAPRVTRIECAAALAALGDARGAEHLRKMLGAFRQGPRIEALAFIARFAVTACAADVAALVEHPRGLPLDLIAHTLERLELAPEAREAQGRLDRLRTTA